MCVAIETNDAEKMLQVLSHEANRVLTDYARLRNQIAKIAMLQGDDDHALREIELVLSQVSDDRDALNLRGLASMHKEDLDSAVVNFEEIFKISKGESILDRTWRVKSFSNRGIIALKRKDLDEAEKLFQQAFDIAKDMDDPSLRTVVESNLAYICIQKKQYDVALTILNKLIEVEKGIGRQFGVGYALDNIGLALTGKACLLSIGSPERDSLLEKAWTALNDARIIFERLKDIREQASSEEHLAEVARLQGKAEIAKEFYSKSLAVFDRIKAAEDAKRVREVLLQLEGQVVEEPRTAADQAKLDQTEE